MQFNQIKLHPVRVILQ